MERNLTDILLLIRELLLKSAINATYHNFTIISSNIKIYTSYPEAWYKSLNSTLGKIVEISVEPESAPTHVRIEPKVGGKDIGLYITEFPVYIQIGPGWIK